jgi:GntR family transcriptional regulator, rspAB operon transcriptional repressor
MQLIARLPALRRDRQRQATPQVYQALREGIMALDLPPGSVLSRAELAAHFGVSQTPVREALTRLGEEGLVDIYPQHATVVSRIDIGAALQAHFLRRAIELELVHELAAQPLAEGLVLTAQLKQQVQRQVTAQRAADYAAFSRADHDFHQALYQAAGMTTLWELVRQRAGHVDRLRRLHLPARGKTEAVLRDHRAIIKALAACDAIAAQAALRRHLAGTLTFVHQVRERHPDWVCG